MNRKWTRMGTFAGLLIILLWMWRSGVLLSLTKLDLDEIRELAHDHLMYLLLIMLLIMIIQNVLTVIPIVLVISLNVSLFGFMAGFLWSWLSSMVGCTLAFVAVRYWFQQTLVKKLNRTWLERIERNGFWYVFLGRIILVVPTNLINIAAGVSSIRLKSFLLSTLLGNFLYFFFVALFAHGIFSAESEILVNLLLVAVVVAIIFFIWRRKTR